MKYPSFIISLLFLLSLSVFVTGCSGDKDEVNPTPPTPSVLVITDVSIPTLSEVAPNSEIRISGKGFASGDQISLQSKTDPATIYTITDAVTTAASITFALPDGISSGVYETRVLRGTESLILGTLTLKIATSAVIPDKAGMNIKGMVWCEGQPIPGVSVSDGIQLAQTDTNGIYYLNSSKKNGYVFISVPSGYETDVDKSIPLFFKRITLSASEVEQRDFELKVVDNDQHTMIAFTDVHLANRNNDRKVFTEGFLREIKQTLLTAEASGERIYGIALGDLSWDVYWYTGYNMSNYRSEIGSLDCAIFSCPGNHDNDPYVANDDWRAATQFRTVMGPPYFSFNIGKVHYILLDNVEYVNTGGSQGNIGDRNYNRIVVAEQMGWLKQDLATLKDKSAPIVVGMHVPLYKRPNPDTPNELNLANAEELIACFDGFTNVTFLSGHTHFNFNVTEGAAIREHNIAAVCATWWWTSKSDYDAHNEICVDGSPGGYKVFKMNGTQSSWYYKGTGKDKNYQFRTYDLNEVLITPAAYCPEAISNPIATKLTCGYDVPNKRNEVLINIWDWDPKWTLTVREQPGDKVLTPVQLYTYDPLHVISQNMQRLRHSPTATSINFTTEPTFHMFKVTATSASSTLEITATNGAGTSYQQTMTRPKLFDFQMQ